MADNLANTNGRVREWIGPRIIPVFADEVQWDINSTYEPLMMVQYAGETFMSRQYVPAGVQLPNTDQDEESNDYWVHMSNWNAQVEYYRQEVLAFDSRIDTLEDDLPTTSFDSTNTVKKYIDDADDDIKEIIPATSFDSTNTIKKYIDDNNALINAKIDYQSIGSGIALAFGDSITRGYGLATPSTQNWFNQLASFNGWEAYNYAIDGASFSSTGNAVSTQVATAAADTSFDNSDVKYVFIGAGINDRSGSQANIEGGISTTITAIRNNFTNAKIYAVPCLCASRPLNNINQGDGVLNHERAVTIINNFFRRYSAVYTFTHAWKWLQGLAGQNSQDEVHPDVTGALIIANNVNAELHGAHSYANMVCVEIASKTSDYIPTAMQSKLTDAKGHLISDGQNWILQGYITLASGQSLSVGEAIIYSGVISDSNPEFMTPGKLLGWYTGSINIPCFIRGGSFMSYADYTNNTGTNLKLFFYASGVVGI